MKRVLFFYDVVCPYAYLASTQVEVLRAPSVELVYKPFLLGGVFRARGAPDDPNRAMSPAKSAHNRRDMQRWAAVFGVPLKLRPDHPRRTVLALRTILASGAIETATSALFAAYFRHERDIASEDVVARTLDEAGLDGEATVRAARTDSIKRELFERTDEAVRRGVFGAPAFVVDDGERSQLFWGQDRLEFVKKALAGWYVPPPADLGAFAPAPGAGG